MPSGGYPESTGIGGESWFDAASRKMPTASAALRQAGTLADEITLADSRNRVFALDASLMARKTLTLDQPAADEADWVAAFRQSHSPDRFKNAKWQAFHADPSAPPLRVLEDDPARPEDSMALYHASPAAHATQVEFLRAAIAKEKLEQDPALDFVTAVLIPMALLSYEV